MNIVKRYTTRLKTEFSGYNGKKFGKDHTTVLYTVEKIKNIIKNNEESMKILQRIK